MAQSIDGVAALARRIVRSGKPTVKTLAALHAGGSGLHLSALTKGCEQDKTT